MDSEDSRGASSGSESNDDGGPQSPDSTKSHNSGSHARSSVSRSRSSSPPSRPQSPLSQHSRDTPLSPPENVSNQIGSPSPSRSISRSRSRSKSKSQSPSRSRSRGSSVSSEDNENLEPEVINRSHAPKSPKTPESDHVSPVRSIGILSPTPPVDKEVEKDTSPTSPPHHAASPFSRYSSRSSSPASPRVHSPIRHQIDSPASPRPESKTDTIDNNDDKASVKSVGSSSSRKSLSSRGSIKSRSSRGSRRSRRKSSSSDSSDSSEDSGRRKTKIKSPDTRPEEISDGDIESEHEKGIRKNVNNKGSEINITHEDLSDVSDLEGSLDGHIDHKTDVGDDDHDIHDHNEKLKEKSDSPDIKKQLSEKSNRPEEGEEQLDFEAEDGECADIEIDDKSKERTEKQIITIGDHDRKLEERKEPKEELEEGEVTDEDDVRPEETEPRPVCRFFSRGQCTWGASCRFLHPGVTDKGNYTMFELIRPVVPGEYGRDERMYGRPEPPLVESAWERGLRTAKEMLRKSVKRKEQDIDFEEKKMNLSLAQEEFDKENGYYGRGPSPEPRFVRHIPAEYPVTRPPHDEYYNNRRQVLYEPEFVPTTSRERMRPYRELPAHRIPDYYDNKFDDAAAASKRPRPKREVIVQRVEERPARGDEWSDPWMRSKSPAGRRKDRKRSYSSGSSYSSSSSSRSTSDTSRSSYRSRSRSSYRRRNSRSRRSRHVSPSVIVSERKAANERAALMNPPAPKKRAPSPGMMRLSSAANPPAPLSNRSKLAMAAALARVKSRRSSRSSSGSSGSSSSDSDSSDSSSSTSRDNSPTRRPPGVDISIVKAMDALKGSALEKNKIKLNLKNPVGVKKTEASELARKADLAQSKKRPPSSPPTGEQKSKKTTSRREELLKQLKAVEDAIAKKRSKVN